MRTLVIAIATVLSVFFLQTHANAQDAQDAQESSCKQPPVRTISVSGEAEVRVVPDQVIIYMTAETRGKNLIETRKKNDKTISSLVNFTSKELKVDEKNIQTDQVSIQPVYQRCDYDDELSGRCNPLEIVYYSVSKGLQIRLGEVGKYDEIITAALNYGVTNIDNVQFITTELRKHRDEAREMAAKASMEKASAIAKTLGMEIGKPINVNTQNVYSYYNSMFNRNRGGNSMMQNSIMEASPGSMSGESDGLALGQIKISATVNATYEMK